MCNLFETLELNYAQTSILYIVALETIRLENFLKENGLCLAYWKVKAVFIM